MNNKKLLLATACLAVFLGGVAKPAFAQFETGTLEYWPIAEEDLRNNYAEWKTFLEYHVYREPCQNYRKPPAGYEIIHCEIVPIRKVAAVATVTEIEPAAGEVTVTIDQNAHTIYFDFDRSSIRESEVYKLNIVADEIKRYNPPHVAIGGHTDRAGTEQYNMGLGARRADAVMKALVARGVSGDVLEEKSYGEANPAVPTADGVRKQENRRAVIDFSVNQ